MDKNKIPQAEKLQTKLDKLLEAKEKKQTSFEKAKLELNAVSKEVDSVYQTHLKTIQEMIK
jgi:hypothetical protein